MEGACVPVGDSRVNQGLSVSEKCTSASCTLRCRVSCYSCWWQPDSDTPHLGELV